MRWIDKIAVFLVCTVLLIMFKFFDYAPAVLCIALIYTCLHFIFRKTWVQMFLLYSYIILCLIMPVFIFYIPLIVYDNFFKPLKYNNLVLLIPLIYNFDLSKSYILIILAIALAIVLKYKTDELYETRESLIKVRDDSTEYSNLLKEKNEKLIENQNFELSVATLNERDRISKELHDSIGHMLSRSLIQVGAISTIAKDETVNNELYKLKESLSEGMDSVRETIHNMRDESFDLYAKTKEIIEGFDFCKIYFEYEVKLQPSIEIKYFIVSTLKESLSNIIKHSNASVVNVSVIEHPSIYQFVVSDNGQISYESQKNLQESFKNGDDLTGMGVSGMIERVNKLKGIINISLDDGFKIFVSIKK